MTVEPLVAYSDNGSIQIVDLNKIQNRLVELERLSVECPSVDVTTVPPRPPGGGAGIVLLLGLGVLGIAMTSKKK